MSAPTALFLTFDDIDNRWKVVDNKQFCFGDGETQEEAIASARIVSNATIFSVSEPDVIVNRVFDKLFLQFKNDGKFHVVDENGQSYGEGYGIPDAIIITALAEIAGMEVIEHYDNNVNFLGYTMEPIEEDDFLKAELAEAKAIEEILNSFDCYFEEEA